MVRLGIVLGLMAGCFLAGGVVSQRMAPAMFIVTQPGGAVTVGGIVPARINGGSVCEAYDRSANRRLGEYSPRADGICHPEDWRLWHPFGVWPWAR